ncbi:MAG: prepilin-type N-terminal cleavage/methylation domain-containing protein [Minisyncoccales bacterium]
MKKKSKKAFTLIELLVVLGVLAVLTSVVFISFQKPKAKSRDVKRISDIRQFVISQEMYEETHKLFFSAPRSLGLPAIPNFMPAIDDPKAGKHYYWLDNTQSPTTFCVFAILENNEECPREKPIRVFFGYPERTKDLCLSSTDQITLENCPPE